MNTDTQETAAQIAEDVETLREALAAGPTPGPWRMTTDWSRGAVYSMTPGLKRVVCSGNQNNFERYERADWSGADLPDAHYIAEASPDRITRLLDTLERERAARQAAQRELEQARAERNAARLQGERDARRTLQHVVDQALTAEREACIDLVAFHGGPVDLEAAIRARGAAPACATGGA